MNNDQQKKKLHLEVLEAIKKNDIEALEQLKLQGVQFDYKPDEGDSAIVLAVTTAKEPIDPARLNVIKFLINNNVNPWLPNPSINAILLLDSYPKLQLQYLEKYQDQPSGNYSMKNFYAELLAKALAKKDYDLFKLYVSKIPINRLDVQSIFESKKHKIKDLSEFFSICKMIMEIHTQIKLSATPIFFLMQDVIKDGSLELFKKNLIQIKSIITQEKYFKLLSDLISSIAKNGKDRCAMYKFLKSECENLNLHNFSLADIFENTEADNKSNLEFFTLMLNEKNINPNSYSYSGEHILFFLTRTKQFETLKLLLEHKRLKLDVFNESGFTPLDIARHCGFTDAISLIEKRLKEEIENPEIVKYREQIRLVRKTGHIMGVKAEMVVGGGLIMPSRFVNSEGSFILPSLMELKESVDDYHAFLAESSENKDRKEFKETKEIKETKHKQEISGKIEIFGDILAAIKSAEEYLKFHKTPLEGAEQLLKKYQADELVILPTIINKHAVGVALYNGYLMFSNRGDYHKIEPGTYVYKLKSKDKITADFIKNLYTFAPTMEIIETAILQVVEEKPILKTEAKPQKFGTCSFVNLKSLIELILFVYEMARSNDNELSKRLAALEYKKLTNYIRNNYLDDLLSKLENTQGGQRGFLLENLYQIVLFHHGQKRYSKKRVEVPHAYKPTQEINRANRILLALDETERREMIAKLDLAIPGGLINSIFRGEVGDSPLVELLIKHGAQVPKSGLLEMILEIIKGNETKWALASILKDPNLNMKLTKEEIFESYLYVKTNFGKFDGFKEFIELLESKFQSIPEDERRKFTLELDKKMQGELINVALKTRNYKLIRMVIDHGASLNKVDPDYFDRAILWGITEIAEALCHSPNIKMENLEEAHYWAQSFIKNGKKLIYGHENLCHIAKLIEEAKAKAEKTEQANFNAVTTQPTPIIISSLIQGNSESIVSKISALGKKLKDEKERKEAEAEIRRLLPGINAEDEIIEVSGNNIQIKSGNLLSLKSISELQITSGSPKPR